jgi:hypothetical protein
VRLQRGYGCREVVAPGLAPVKAVEAVGDHDPLSAHPERNSTVSCDGLECRGPGVQRIVLLRHAVRLLFRLTPKAEDAQPLFLQR